MTRVGWEWEGGGGGGLKCTVVVMDSSRSLVITWLTDVVVTITNNVFRNMI